MAEGQHGQIEEAQYNLVGKVHFGPVEESQCSIVEEAQRNPVGEAKVAKGQCGRLNTTGHLMWSGGDI